ncbi:glutamyl-tRNA synthetase [Dokdonia sp. Hel_I_63]|uniref:glutamate--tRNA ligase n=1 Tax=unclassified Dokdonia TaxID=2615033 RepID=UPI00020A7141|nr:MULTISPECIES: glutamate--tRNA ligase [unclassified Dokdonia]AEE19155.1 glutamyl-tRNA synthetase [Dokdonia sp. 4H-3-7-5]TVZ21608.1 glutamyl-tRNA synthetase [Dokdonia sp. Hel_I_63]
MSQNVRVRFAPSPTGPLHIGGVRTALFNYLFAKKHGGTFILRIEDTDQNRYVPGAEDYIRESLDWCGISYDEGPTKDGGFGPYRQSERKDKYHAFAKALVDSNNAYYAFDTAESLDAHRKDHEANGKTFIYNWHNRLKLDNSLVLSQEETEKRIAAGENYVIRFKSPQDEVLQLRDEIRGAMEIDTNILDDKVLFKSDGMPTYHLANIVDDHLMEITHVIRGEEWLPSLALHVLLYRAFGWDAPVFAHLPLILKPVGKGKLSKRDGDKLGFPVFPLQWEDPKSNEISSGYREDGYFAEAMVNMLAFLGWNPGTEQEIFSLEELVAAFDLKRVNKAGAKFDPEKTKWFQQQYMQESPVALIADQFMTFLKDKNVTTTEEYTTHVVDLIKERAIFVEDLWTLGSYFFTAPTEFDEKAAKKAWKEDTAAIMEEVKIILSSVSNFTTIEAQTTLKEWIVAKELGFGKVMQPFRLSLVGAMQGPDVFDIATTIGKEETLRRIGYAITTLG